MKYTFFPSAKYSKDLKKIKDKEVLKDLRSVINK